jgi:hypothetical protein
LLVFLTTHPDTFSAKDATVRVIGDKWVRCVQRLPLGWKPSKFCGSFELDLDFAGNLLELAIFVFPANTAIKVVIGEEQLESGLSNLAYFRRLRVNYQAVPDWLRAGGHQSSSFNVHVAEATPPEGQFGLRYVTQIGNIDPGIQCSLQDPCPWL